MTDNTPTKPHCVVCKQTSDELPLLALTYGEQTLHICPQHLPILIHKPQQLAGILPGAENLTEADHDH